MYYGKVGKGETALSKLRYALDHAAHADWSALLETARQVHRETGKPTAAVLWDINACALRYGAGYNDYLLCEFFHLNEEQRATYVTRRVNERLVQLLNDPAYYHIFDNKSEFYRRFAAYLGREWLDLSAASPVETESFLAGRDQVMGKPDAGTGGHGVEKYRRADFASTAAMRQQLAKDGVGVIEDVLEQHPDLRALHPASINTLRIVTVVNGEGPHIVYAHLRIGNHGRPVDNLHSGGMFAPIDGETGAVRYPAYDKERHTFPAHPMTGVEIRGFRIPFWREAKDLCLRAATEVPQMRYIGWDVCVTPRGPVFVEGNNFPGYDILQMPPHTPDKIGMIPEFRKYVDGI